MNAQAIINTVAGSLTLDEDNSHADLGSWDEYPPPSEVYMYGTPSEINYGYQILRDRETTGVNATTVYRDVNGTTDAFAVIVHFSMPGMRFPGVELRAASARRVDAARWSRRRRGAFAATT